MVTEVLDKVSHVFTLCHLYSHFLLDVEKVKQEWKVMAEKLLRGKNAHLKPDCLATSTA